MKKLILLLFLVVITFSGYSQSNSGARSRSHHSVYTGTDGTHKDNTFAKPGFTNKFSSNGGKDGKATSFPRGYGNSKTGKTTHKSANDKQHHVTVKNKKTKKKKDDKNVNYGKKSNDEDN